MSFFSPALKTPVVNSSMAAHAAKGYSFTIFRMGSSESENGSCLAGAGRTSILPLSRCAEAGTSISRQRAQCYHEGT
jgi:hypothetical protein